MKKLETNYWDKFGTSRGGLMEVAHEYRKRAYAPYSNFTVGAALLMSDGSVVGGCNVENGSYGLSICAERVAMTTAIAAGKRTPLAVAVAGPEGAFCSPCGACRQFLSEFAGELEILLMEGGKIVSFTLDELLPRRFNLRGAR